jgi:hypothetical protein
MLCRDACGHARPAPQPMVELDAGDLDHQLLPGFLRWMKASTRR